MEPKFFLDGFLSFLLQVLDQLLRALENYTDLLDRNDNFHIGLLNLLFEQLLFVIERPIGKLLGVWSCIYDKAVIFGDGWENALFFR